MSLYLKYRPNSFDEVYGNENICETIQSIIKKERKPHAYLFHGPTGCGKTTLGRILADKLGCKGNDLREIDSADFRGIDTVREIRKQAQFKPLESPCRVWLIDECFAKGTKIKSPNGEKNIENFSIGDSVYSLAGVSQIKNIFKNKVDLNQVVKLSFSNGKTLYTTKQHLFLTKCGWKESQYLNKKDFIFSFDSYIVDSINLTKRERAFIEKKYIERYEKRKTIKKIRVENIAIYKRGSNNESFSNIITDKERDQDYITFYDLEIDKHPSYFANEIAVHNCHKLTNDAQNALLKALEDTPSHVYFILCTTDPQKLIVTIKGRCSQFQVHPLSDRQMFKLLRHVVKAEEDTLHKEVYDQIIQDSLGHPRNALQILEQVLNVESEKRLMVAKRSAEIQSQSIELCRALIDTSGWKKVANILEGLKNEDSENIRRAILGYCQAILLKGINNQAGLVMEYMIEPFYNTGYPGLVFACYSIKCGD